MELPKQRCRRVLSIFILAMLNVSIMASLRNLPLVAEFGLIAIFYFFIVGLIFLIPCALISASSANPTGLIVTHKSLSRGERGKKFSCLSMTPIAGSPTGGIERQENLKPQPPIERGLVGNDQPTGPLKNPANL